MKLFGSNRYGVMAANNVSFGSGLSIVFHLVMPNYQNGMYLFDDCVKRRFKTKNRIDYGMFVKNRAMLERKRSHLYNRTQQIPLENF
jgi:hypothetical protein